MRIVVQLTPAATKELRAPGARHGHRHVLAWLQEPLTPMHPQTTDPSLASFFEVHVSDPAAASRLAERLQGDPAVDAAYVKPDDELPSM